MTRPTYLPAIPAEWYTAIGIFRDPTQGYVWGNLTEGYATFDDSVEAVAYHIDDISAICHAKFGIQVVRIRLGVSEDVTAQVLEALAEWREKRGDFDGAEELRA